MKNKLHQRLIAGLSAKLINSFLLQDGEGDIVIIVQNVRILSNGVDVRVTSFGDTRVTQ